MGQKEKKKQQGPPSSNWLALQKKLPKAKASSSSHADSSVSAVASRKRRKLDHPSESLAEATTLSASASASSSAHTNAFPRGTASDTQELDGIPDQVKNGESVHHLRKMVLGLIDHSPAHHQPGKYLALDCEMVGVGLDGEESALARVSLVNFYGVVLVDAFVRPRERVVDYRTQFSGIRPADMVHAEEFEEVQKRVAGMLKDRVLVGHAVHNDLKALLLSHPRPATRDTQQLYPKHGLVRGRRPALRNLVKTELGLVIQAGEHSSVTDARATMALFRLHRKEWEKDFRPLPQAAHPLPAASSGSGSDSAVDSGVPSGKTVSRKRPRGPGGSTVHVDEDGEDEESGADEDEVEDKGNGGRRGKAKAKRGAEQTFPGGGRRGVSSGLSTVIKRAPARGKGEKGGRVRNGGGGMKTKTQEKWWKDLGGGAKGSVRMAAGR
ncbi:ribonuclease H-like domain-containing protein [Trametes maxima]|nr:ribonuclease H-like domain-containing protein [Trametes maxima]